MDVSYTDCFIHRTKWMWLCAMCLCCCRCPLLFLFSILDYPRQFRYKILCQLCKFGAHFIQSCVSVAHAQMYCALIKINIEMSFNKTHFGDTNNKHHGFHENGSCKELNITWHNNIHRNKTIKIQYCLLVCRANETTTTAKYYNNGSKQASARLTE